MLKASAKAFSKVFPGHATDINRTISSGHGEAKK